MIPPEINMQTANLIYNSMQRSSPPLRIKDDGTQDNYESMRLYFFYYINKAKHSEAN